MSLRTGFGLIVLSLVLVFGFQNCTKAKFAEAESFGKLSSEEPIAEEVVDPVDVVEVEDEVEESEIVVDKDSIKCVTSLENQDLPLQLADDAKDLTVKDERGNKKYLDIKALVLDAVSGNIQVRADKVDIAKAGGNIRVKANSVESVADSRGNICLAALKVGKVSKVNGNLRIAAEEIDEISDFTGNLRIHGATVKLLSGIKSGNICLHGGAKVLAVSNVAVRIHNCD